MVNINRNSQQNGLRRPKLPTNIASVSELGSLTNGFQILMKILSTSFKGVTRQKTQNECLKLFPFRKPCARSGQLFKR